MIDWKKQHCGVHQACYDDAIKYMPDIKCILDTFPENVLNFVWDIKVHMLMPNQYPCIPNWHFDNVPRVNNVQDFEKITPHLPMYLWVSNSPLTEFRKNGENFFIKPQEWFRFTQEDEHRGSVSTSFQWRGFIRATHKGIMKSNNVGDSCLRRHSQVYLNSETFRW